MSKILVPTQSASDWKRFLADPVKHWRPGYSARTLALCWEASPGFPDSVRRVLDAPGSGLPGGLEMLLGIPEHKVPLRGGRRASQTDLFVIAGSSDGLVVICVEGKVNESFGPLMSEWLTDDASAGKRERLAELSELLGLTDEQAGDALLRYQLFHRTASAVKEARRFGARHAVMLVHSFSAEDTGLADYRAFGARLGAQVDADRVTQVGPPREGVQLSLGWVRGEAQYLDAAEPEGIPGGTA